MYIYKTLKCPAREYAKSTLVKLLKYAWAETNEDGSIKTDASGNIVTKWVDIDESTDKSSNEVGHARFHIIQNELYIDTYYKYKGNVATQDTLETFHIDLVIGEDIRKSLVETTKDEAPAFSIFTYGNMLAISMTKGSKDQQYKTSMSPFLFIDSVNAGTDIGAIAFFNSDNNLYAFDSACISNDSQSSVISKSTTTASEVAEVMPYINTISGKKFDTLDSIIITPENKKFVIFNNELWAFFEGIAVQCGDSYTDIYVEPATTIFN